MSVSSDMATSAQHRYHSSHSVAGESRLDISTKEHKGAGKMAQQVTALAAALDNLSSVPRTHMVEAENQLPLIIL